MYSDTDFTGLLAKAKEGDATAAAQASAALYTELHDIAAAYMRRERSGHTLQPTALVNEAYLRLPQGLASVNDRHHFFALAAQAMRRVLVDHARRRASDKRGANPVRVTLSGVPSTYQQPLDVLALDEAITKLAEVDARAARVVELRFFCGHTDKVVADMLNLSVASVRRDWEYARAWLRIRLGP
jgi:RNA polymerase sigma-70 factor (ECF subfamily)